MAHFAQIDDDNIVIQVIVVADEDTSDEDGNEVESIGIEFCQKLFGGTWLQTSYNHNQRNQFAGIGWTYDPDLDIFLSPSPFPSWSLDENYVWQAPTPRPDGDDWYWDEENTTWVEIPQDE